MIIKEKENLRPDEVAKLLDISRRSVYRLILQGELTAFKIGSALRITGESVELFKKRKIKEFQESNAIFCDCV